MPTTNGGKAVPDQLPINHCMFFGAKVFMYCEVVDDGEGGIARLHEYSGTADPLRCFFTLYGYPPHEAPVAMLDGSFQAIRNQAEALREQGAEVSFISSDGLVT